MYPYDELVKNEIQRLVNGPILVSGQPCHPLNDVRALQRIGEWLSAQEWVIMLQDNPARLYDY